MTLCYLRCVFISVWMLHRNVSGTTLNITPSQVQIGGTNPTTLNGTCTPPATYVVLIVIGRKRLSSGSVTPMVEIASGFNNDQPIIKDGSMGSRLCVQGDIKTDPKSLSFSLQDPTCDDIKDYTFYCITVLTLDRGEHNEDFKNVTYIVNPDDVKMIVFPSYDKYDRGTLVTFTCTALIGSNFPTDQSNFWIWEWRNVSQMIPTSWTRYPSSANITYGTPTPAANCNYNGRSELKHTVTEYDVERQFRCYIVNSDLYSANGTISIEEVSLKQSFNLVILISSLVGVVVIVIAVLFGILIYRNRRHRGSPSNDVSVYNIPSPYNDNEDRYQELVRVVTPNQVQDLDYLTPQPPQDTHNLPNINYENIEDTEQIQLADRLIWINIPPEENKNDEYVNETVERTS